MSILGINAGKMELRLNGTSFRPGDTISGNSRLTLNEPIKARGVIIEFWAERQKRRGKSSYTEIIFKEARQMDSEREYNPHEGPKSYDFSFTVPGGILSEQQFGSDLIGGVMGFMRDMGNRGIKWFVAAKLDVPMAFDVSAKQAVFVTPGQRTPAPTAPAMQ